jgi:crotonobetainyl-CoA:carnitine CoA-transferase CaiB-like acyl-CoA transferase
MRNVETDAAFAELAPVATASDGAAAEIVGAREALAGLTAIDVSSGVAGQFAGRVLAEHGADVLLVEPPGGCTMRRPQRTEDRYLFRHLNTGKRSIALDRGTAAGRAAFDRLVAHADVLVGEAPEEFTPYVAAHPRLVACVVRDFASTGPYAHWRGSEMIHQALSGLMYTTGRADDEPLYGFGHRAYYSAGAAAVAAIIGGLLVVRRSGHGQLFEVRVHETAIAMSQNLVAQYSYNGSFPARGPYPGACDVFRCRDGWASIYCRGDRWAAMCAALGAPTLPEDPRFAAIDVLLRNWPAAYACLAPRISAMTVEDFIGRVQGARGLASRVNTMADARACVHLDARGFWETMDDGDGPRALLGPLFRMTDTPRRLHRGAPPLPGLAIGEGGASS